MGGSVHFSSGDGEWVYYYPIQSTGYFRKVRTSYNNFVTNDTEVLHSVNLDELNTIATMDLFLNPDEKYLQDVRHFGSVPLYNNGGNGITWIKEKIGYMP